MKKYNLFLDRLKFYFYVSCFFLTLVALYGLLLITLEFYILVDSKTHAVEAKVIELMDNPWGNATEILFGIAACDKKARIEIEGEGDFVVLVRSRSQFLDISRMTIRNISISKQDKIAYTRALYRNIYLGIFFIALAIVAFVLARNLLIKKYKYLKYIDIKKLTKTADAEKVSVEGFRNTIVISYRYKLGGDRWRKGVDIIKPESRNIFLERKIFKIIYNPDKKWHSMIQDNIW